MTRLAGTLREDQYTFLIITRSVLRKRNVSDKSCGENQNSFYIQQRFFFENSAVYKSTWKI
jgi:hypothetical protein